MIMGAYCVGKVKIHYSSLLSISSDHNLKTYIQ